MFNCGCEVDSVSVDFNYHLGYLHVSEGQMPDMMGAARAFMAIDPEIKRIEVFVDGLPDTVYLYLKAINKWQAFPHIPVVFGEVK